MDEYTDATYGDRVADVYDDWYADLPTLLPIETTVGFLRDLARPARRSSSASGPGGSLFLWRGQTSRFAASTPSMRWSFARHLLEGGVFVMEAFVPDLSRYARGQFVAGSTVGTDELRIDVAELDNANQRVDAQHLVIVDGQLPRVYPIQFRFAYHPELDLMARLAGMRLRERWGDWDRSPFTGNGKHISVWELDR